MVSIDPGLRRENGELRAYGYGSSIQVVALAVKGHVVRTRRSTNLR
jgi:hypothetical protein